MSDDLVGVESLLEISEENLDQEWIKQPRLFMKFAQLLAEAKQQHSECKANLDVVHAELLLTVRSEPADYNLIGKLTEKVIDATVQVQPDYKKATARLIRAKYRLDMLQAVVEALDHRKGALENMVKLFLANYFSTPRAEGEKEVLEGKQKDRVRRRSSEAVSRQR